MFQHLRAANKPRWWKWCKWPNRWFWDENWSATRLFNITLVILSCKFPIHLFVNVGAEWVDDLPHDIHGLKLYKIKFSPWEGVQKSPGSEVLQEAFLEKDLIRARKVERGIRNWHFSYDDCPFKLSAEGKVNTSNFQNVDWYKICFSCGNVASRQWCRACKMTEYCRESESLTIYHVGAHKCPFKPYTNKYSKQIRDAVLRNSGLGAHGIQQAEVGQAVVTGDIKETQRRAMQLSYTNIRSEKAKVAHERNSDQTLAGGCRYSEASYRQGRQVPHLQN